MNISEVLEERRDERGISYSELGRRTGNSGEMVARFCKGISTPNGEQFLRICKELGLEIEDFDKSDIGGD